MKDGWNVGVVRKDEPVAGFVGYRLKPRLKDGLLFGVQNVGNGRSLILPMIYCSVIFGKMEN